MNNFTSIEKDLINSFHRAWVEHPTGLSDDIDYNRGLWGSKDSERMMSANRINALKSAQQQLKNNPIQDKTLYELYIQEYLKLQIKQKLHDWEIFK